VVEDFDISENQNQSIWADITIPRDTAVGTYRGELTVLEAGTETHRIPLELDVWNLTLPDETQSKTMVVLGYGDINLRYLGDAWPNESEYGDRGRAIRDRHFMMAHRHRIELIDSNVGPGVWNEDAPRPEWLPRLDGTLFTAENGYSGPGEGVGTGIFSIGNYGAWACNDEGRAGMWTHTDAWATWFATNSPTTEYFLYLIDESSNYAQIETWAQWMASNPGPGSSVLSMATLPATVAVRETPSLQFVASSLWVGDTDPWQNAVDSLHEDSDNRVVFYNGHRPATGSLATEDEGVSPRTVPWAQYKLGIDRWFFWESTYYNNFQGGTGHTDVFESAFTFGSNDSDHPVNGRYGWNYNNGDGVLFYPGTDTLFPDNSYGVDGPFASLRLKYWRRGIQDVEYLVMAAEIDQEAVDRIVQQMIPKVMWEYGVNDPRDPTWVRTEMSWPIDPTAWDNARHELADIILGR